MAERSEVGEGFSIRRRSRHRNSTLHTPHSTLKQQPVPRAAVFLFHPFVLQRVRLRHFHALFAEGLEPGEEDVPVDEVEDRGGFFLRFAIEEVPEKKKGAAGVRGMKLADNDELTAVYFTGPSDKGSIEYHEKTLEINRLKIAGRDGKGTRQK